MNAVEFLLLMDEVLCPIAPMVKYIGLGPIALWWVVVGGASLVGGGGRCLFGGWWAVPTLPPDYRRQHY